MPSVAPREASALRDLAAAMSWRDSMVRSRPMASATSRPLNTAPATVVSRPEARLSPAPALTCALSCSVEPARAVPRAPEASRMKPARAPEARPSPTSTPTPALQDALSKDAPAPRRRSRRAKLPQASSRKAISWEAHLLVVRDPLNQSILPTQASAYIPECVLNADLILDHLPVLKDRFTNPSIKPVAMAVDNSSLLEQTASSMLLNKAAIQSQSRVSNSSDIRRPISASTIVLGGSSGCQYEFNSLYDLWMEEEFCPWQKRTYAPLL